MHMYIRLMQTATLKELNIHITKKNRPKLV